MIPITVRFLKIFQVCISNLKKVSVSQAEMMSSCFIMLTRKFRFSFNTEGFNGNIALILWHCF